MNVCLNGGVQPIASDSLMSCLLTHGSSGEWTVLTLCVIAVVGGYAMARSGAFDLTDI